jgi:hypothetical protein
LLAVVAAVALRHGVQRGCNRVLGRSDPRIILMVALVANIIGFLVGAGVGRLLADRGLQREENRRD